MSEFLRRDPAALGLLAASHRETWKAFTSALSSTEVCPLDLVRQVLAIDSVDGWGSRIGQAFTGLHPDEGMGADFAFRRWLNAGIERGLPSTEPPALELRLQGALEDGSAAATSHVQALVAEFEKAGDSVPHRHLLGRALLLLARRLGEDGDDEGAAASAQRAEEVFARSGHETGRAQAVRAHAAASLRAGRIDDALALLDGVLDSQHLWLGGVLRTTAPSEPTAAALHHAARTADFASRRSGEWVVALGVVAERTGHAGCAARFESGLRSFVDAADTEPDKSWNPGASGLGHVVSSHHASVPIARRAAELIADRFPMNPDAASKAGRFFVTHGELQRAARLFARTLEAKASHVAWASQWVRSAAGKWSPAQLEVLRATLASARASLAADGHQAGVAAIERAEKELALSAP